MRALLGFFLIVLLLASLTCVAYASDVNDGDMGGFFAKMFDFVKGLFFPSSDYFPNQIQRLQGIVNKKMGGVGYLYSMLKNFFTQLKNTSVSTALTFSIPDNFLFKGDKGITINLLESAAVYIKLLRDVVNVVVCLVTAMVCYKKLSAFFSG